MEATLEVKVDDHHLVYTVSCYVKSWSAAMPIPAYKGDYIAWRCMIVEPLEMCGCAVTVEDNDVIAMYLAADIAEMERG